ncbi:MAG: hypothetical protein HC812_16655 [Leptolyngbya sp. RL_3_1]|nr:hypothetical protein [Leptolyngbya sp. RL_3_1]
MPNESKPGKRFGKRPPKFFDQAINHLEDSDFRDAFSAAIRLRTVGNEYWATTKYEELTQLITATRRDLNTLAQARRLLRQGSTDAVLEALELAQSIGSESPLHDESQRLLKDIGRELLTLAEAALERADSDRALELLGKNSPGSRLGGRGG